MAGIGFSYQNSPLVFDSFMVPTNISNNLSTSIQEETTCFSHICPFDYFLQDIPLHPPLLDTISTSTTTSNPNSSSSSSSSSSSMKLETRAQNQAISKVVTGSMVKSREKKKKKIIDISKVEKEGNKKGRKEKRKSDAMLKVITEEKKLKAAAEDHHHHHKKAKKEDDNITPTTTTTTTTGYVHVRARRGEATDSHSLAERVRREKIGERMRLLQSLVPGCDKIRGKAQVLDAIINYVQSIQNQVEFLLAKLASVGPMFNEFEYDFDANPLVSEGNGVPSWEINEQFILELVNQDAELNNLYHFY